MMARNGQKSSRPFGFIFLLFFLAFIINIAWGAPLAPAQFTWGIIDQDGGSPYDLGVNDANNSTPLVKGDAVQLIWVGPNGQIDSPTYNGLVSGDDQLLVSSTIEKDPGNTLPPPLRNKGYIIPELFSYDSTDVWEGKKAYVRAWNHPNAGGYNGATFYGNSATFTLVNQGTQNLATWHTNRSATQPEIQIFETAELVSGNSVVNFGNTTLGSPLKKTFTIRNIGVDPLIISLPIGISNNAFSVSTPLNSTTINSQAQATFELQLNATAVGSYSTVISISNNDTNENPFTFTVTGEVAAAEISVSVDGNNLPDGSGSVNFGTTQAGTPVTKVFTVQNTGAGELKISDLIVPVGFSVVQNIDSPTVIGTNQTATFSIKMDAITAGMPGGIVQFTTNDADENPFNFAVNGAVVEPEIAVTENGVNVASGGGTIVDYGATLVNSPVVKSFTVTNNGTANLTLANLTVPAGFSIAANFSNATVAPNNTATFQIRLNAAAAGMFNGLISFNTNDNDENPFVFTVYGVVTTTPVPEIQVLNNNTHILDGSGLVDFGSTTVNTAVQKTFMIRNSGSANLTLSALNVPTGFNIISGFGAGTVTPGQSTTFVVALTANAVGVYEGALSFSNNDSDENPFSFTVRGVVTAAAAPEIVVTEGGIGLIDGVSTVDFGSATVGIPVVKTIMVSNSGTAALALSAPTLPHGFSLLRPFGSTNLAPGQSTTMQIQLNATAVKSYVGFVSFDTNDSDENPFNFLVEGLVRATPIPEITVLDGSTSVLDNTSSVNFGSTVIGTPIVKSFVVRNIGSADLSLSALTVPAGFEILNSFDTTVAPGGSTTFRVQLTAATVNTYNGSIFFVTNDANENPFDFVVQGTVTAAPTAEIAVFLGTMELSGTAVNYGSTTIGTPLIKTFTVKNLGSAALTLTEPINVPAGYSVISSFANTTLVPGGSTTFRVRLNAATPGNPAGNIQFNHNDNDKNPFVIPVAGTVTVVSNPQPEVEVVANGILIADGTGIVDFGRTAIGAPIFQTIVVNNVGTANLALSGLTVPAGYTVVNPFSATAIVPGDAAVFQVRLNAVSGGTFNGDISFATNDGDENPFSFSITAEVTETGAAATSVFLPLMTK